MYTYNEATKKLQELERLFRKKGFRPSEETETSATYNRYGKEIKFEYGYLNDYPDFDAASVLITHHNKILHLRIRNSDDYNKTKNVITDGKKLHLLFTKPRSYWYKWW